MDGIDNLTEWRLLPYPGKKKNYYASNVGQILGRYASSGKVKVLKPYSPNYSPAASHKGKGKLYKFAGSSPSQALYKLYVHRLVASVFCPCPSLLHKQVDHIDGNKFNNNAANLRWVTQKENMRARYALKRGEINITNLQKSMFYVN